ncbi:hypothetical protein HYPSUDRAFT_206369 [Hypholoma sublateritium FD-334 SS-4]|uniref:Uncharacterized protein n=1 Tax=Hypholoma sublateritium (strain FD-334 SS-4) TaxID=945553 RepID=A0A0D2M264_HYPSF|nr:hypothetical protein HYPSUDRAFT_206369 [Hypholoma sublateritium FD-334 SS-4]
MVITAISLLYLVNTAAAGVQWFVLRKIFITNGITRGTAFGAVFQTAFLDTLLVDIFAAIVCVVADALLIWRCYKVWGNSLRVIFMSLVLVVAETALYLSIIVIACASNVNPSVSTQIILDKLSTAALCMTFGATLLTTVLIAYKIYSFKRRDPRKGTSRPYADIADVLVQSAAAYSLVVLWIAVVGVIPQDNANATAIFCASNYAGVLLPIAAGMAPTIMVARVAMQELSGVVDTHTAHLSDLEFRGHSNPSGHTTQIPSHGIRAPAGGRANESSEGPRDSEKEGR